MNIGIIGLGRWGKQLLRVFNDLADVKYCANKENVSAQKWVKENYPQVKTTFDYQDILHDSLIDAVVITTPVKTHFTIAQEALKAEKNVFLEKPMTVNVKEAEKLINLAEEKVLFIGHTFLYHPVYRKIKELASQDEPSQVDIVWNKFGTFKEDIILNLACHDVAIALDLFKDYPLSAKVLQKKGIISETDIIKIDLEFSNNKKCIININRAHHTKNKEIRIITENGSLLYWSDNQLFRLNNELSGFDLLLDNKEDILTIECQEFINSVKESKRPESDGRFGLQVVKVLDMLKRN